jgi:hypothetical protein
LRKRTAAIIGLVCGILILVSLSLNWVLTYRAKASGIDFLQVGENGLIIGQDAFRKNVVVVGSGEGQVVGGLVLVGGILALVGGILALLSGRFMKISKAKVIKYLPPIGGVLALAGGIWAYAKIGQAMNALGGSVAGGQDIGLYLCIIGAVLVLFISSSLWEEE